jgi:hypothetical protein
MKEKIRQLIIMGLITLPMTAWAEEDSTMPDRSLRGEWAELKKEKYSEWTIVEKLEKARTLLSGEGNKDPKLLDSLIERLKSRAPMFKPNG